MSGSGLFVVPCALLRWHDSIHKWSEYSLEHSLYYGNTAAWCHGKTYLLFGLILSSGFGSRARQLRVVSFSPPYTTYVVGCAWQLDESSLCTLPSQTDSPQYLSRYASHAFRPQYVHIMPAARGMAQSGFQAAWC